MICQSSRAPAGGLTTWRWWITRPSTLVVVPSSSSISEPGSTRSA